MGAMKMMGGGMINKLLDPLLAKIPEPYGKKYGMAQVVKDVVGKLVKGDAAGAKQEIKQGLKKVGMKTVMGFLEPIMSKIPAMFRPMIKEAIEKILAGNVKGALGALKKGIFKYGIAKMTTAAKSITDKLPSFAQ